MRVYDAYNMRENVFAPKTNLKTCFVVLDDQECVWRGGVQLSWWRAQWGNIVPSFPRGSLTGVQISFRRFLSKIEHLLLNDVKLLVEWLVMYVQVFSAFGTNFDPIMLQISCLRTHFLPSATFFVFDNKFTVLKLLKPLTTTSFT